MVLYEKRVFNKKEVFISHEHHDQKLAYQLVEYLEARGVGCFVAPRDMDPGQNYAKQLISALKNSRVFVLIASHFINDSEQVLNEVDYFFSTQKPLIPFFTEEFALSDDYRYYLARKHHIMAYPDDPRDSFDKLWDAVKLKDPSLAVDTETLPTKTVFEYDPQRGIMTNPEDHKRNVSFRTDTFISMMGGIYESVEKLSSAEDAHRIFFDSGYVSGKNFAQRIDNAWDTTGHTLEDLRCKLERWCAFDSAVGWGKFSIQIDYDESNNKVRGKLSINEAFMVDKGKKRKVCSFLKGYCTGVLETLMGNVRVELVCAACPLNSFFDCCCVFDIIVKG